MFKLPYGLKYYAHNILELELEQPFGYNANHYSKLLLTKDFIHFLSGYAHSFSVSQAFFHLHM
jgi:hypothetical protein